MTQTADVEVTRLEDTALDSTPPCDMITGFRRFALFGHWVLSRCKRQAEYRIKVTCPVHGTKLRFLCARDLRIVKLGFASCWECDNRNFVRFAGHT